VGKKRDFFCHKTPSDIGLGVPYPYHIYHELDEGYAEEGYVCPESAIYKKTRTGSSV
jgi:hypothetical protein